MAEGFRGLLELQGIVPAAVGVLPNAGIFGLLGLQGIVVHSRPLGTAANAGLSMFALTGVLIPRVPGVAPVVQRDCNWGSWCKRFVVGG